MTINSLKTQLFNAIENLEEEQSLFPFSKPETDRVIRQLEQINPNPRPLLSENLSRLLGNWQLVYTSNGTVVTRQIYSVGNVLTNAIKIKKIWQNIATDRNGKITANNNALIEFPILGEYRISADGSWESDLDWQKAKVTFDTFSIETTKFLGQPEWNFPEISIPILEFLRKEALWITSYLDENTRIGRGATGNLFVFRR